jgi:hypothetical protein
MRVTDPHFDGSQYHSEKDARDLLTAVATAHTEAAAGSQSPERHQEVVEIVRRILIGK